MLEDFTADMAVRYPGSPPTAATYADFAPPAGLFLLGLADEQPVACGGLRTLEPGVGELKKVYVAPAARGAGVGRALVRALVDSARGLGLPRLVLQTGTGQPEAVRLYEREGWQPIAPYGEYRDDPRCRCYALGP